MVFGAVFAVVGAVLYFLQYGAVFGFLIWLYNYGAVFIDLFYSILKCKTKSKAWEYDTH